MKKRILSFLLVLAMLLSIAPMAMAVADPMEETYTYTDSRGNEVVVPVSAFATRVVSFTPGENWTSKKQYTDPEKVVGKPGQESQNLCMGEGGVLVLEFAVDIVDNEGMDIYVFEVGPDVEPTSVEVSADGREWIYVGDANGSLSGVDLNGVTPEGARYHYVRITDLGKYPNSSTPGADVNAVAGLNVKAVPFYDLDRDAYYYIPVTWAYDNEITNGVGDDLFDPDASCRRQDVVTYLWRINGKPEATISAEDIPFTDVNLDAYYGEALLWAYENDVVKGKTETLFAPEDQIKRCEFVTLLYRNMGEPAYAAENPFEDLRENAYYVDAVIWAYENGITTGVDATHFAPEDPCNRAQVVTFLYRFAQLEKPEQEPEEAPVAPTDPEQTPSVDGEDLMDYLYLSMEEVLEALEGLELVPTTDGSVEYTDGKLIISAAPWVGDGEYVSLLSLNDAYPMTLAGLSVGMSVQEAKDILTDNGWTPVDSLETEWKNADGVIISIRGEDTVTGLSVMCY